MLLLDRLFKPTSSWPKLNVSVRTYQGHTIDHSAGDATEAWATDVHITPGGDLHIFGGFTLRVKYPRGDWTGYDARLAPIYGMVDLPLESRRVD